MMAHFSQSSLYLAKIATSSQKSYFLDDRAKLETNYEPKKSKFEPKKDKFWAKVADLSESSLVDINN